MKAVFELDAGVRSAYADLLAETDGLKARVAELEERLDFAERLLARSDQADQLPGGVER